LIESTDINASCSGSTLVSVVLEDNYITCANVGDSRAILARQGTYFNI
jgi:serine/threonine protein phosphatase PrpC